VPGGAGLFAGPLLPSGHDVAAEPPLLNPGAYGSRASRNPWFPEELSGELLVRAATR